MIERTFKRRIQQFISLVILHLRRRIEGGRSSGRGWMRGAVWLFLLWNIRSNYGLKSYCGYFQQTTRARFVVAASRLLEQGMCFRYIQCFATKAILFPDPTIEILFPDPTIEILFPNPTIAILFPNATSWRNTG